MALFEACAKQFVKDTGRSTLFPVLDLNTSARCDILCVVTKKRSRWFWKSDKYKTTPFSLDELLTKPVDIKGQIKKSIFIANYKNEPKFHVSGKLGAKIATEFGIDVSAIDSFTMSMDVGDVIKREVLWGNLNEALADITLNLDHEYVQYILSKPRRSLCVIYETVATRGDSELDSDSCGQGNASLNAGKPSFSINLSGSVQVAHHRSFELPNNTILGYACNEITFDSAMGTFELVLADATDGGGMSTREHCVFDKPDGQNDKALKAVFDDLLKSPLYSKIIDLYRKILSCPAAVAPVRDLLEKGLSSAEKKTPKPFELKELKTKAVAAYENCKELFLLLGSNMDESGDGNITFPQGSANSLLYCCTALTEALVELSAAQCLALKEVTSEYQEPLLYLLKNAMYGKDTSVDDPLLQRVWTHSANPAKNFLLSLGFDQVVTEGNEKLLQLMQDSEHISLVDTYVAVFVLCST